MDATTLFLYMIAVGAVVVTPGPTMLLALSNGATRGMRVAACGIAGAALADLILIGAVGCGLGAVLLASEQMFAVIKWIGAAYLLYLAWGLWRAPVQALTVSSGEASVNGWAAFLRALFVALSNPKTLLFTSAFVPQFIPPDKPVALQYTILAVVAAILDILMMMIYAFGGQHAMRTMSARAVRWVNRGCAGILAFLAVGLSLYRRSELR